RTLELAVTRVALLAEPCGLGAPVHVVVRLPGVDTTAGEAEGLEAHGLERDVPGEDHQVTPGEGPTVLLLDRPEDAARLVEADVVRPAVQRREALLTGAATTAAVRHAVGTRRVPRHADHERTVVAEVGGPPVLRGGDGLLDVLLDGIQVERLESRLVIEIGTQRVALGSVLRQDLEVRLLGPPRAVGRPHGRVRLRVDDGARAGVTGLDGLLGDGLRLVDVGGVVADAGNVFTNVGHGVLPMGGGIWVWLERLRVSPRRRNARRGPTRW